MSRICRLIDKRLKPIFEFIDNKEWMQDRQQAEDRLFHTIGPLTDKPRWNKQWTSPSEPPPDFVPGGPTQPWAPEEVVFAMAGDPNALKYGRDNPKSPSYGKQGGSPLWRLANQVARAYGKPRDKHFIDDMYSNGFIPLVRMMKPGFDESRSPFISYAMANIRSAMMHGTGGTLQGNAAMGDETHTGVTGIEGILKSQNPDEVRKFADQVQGDFRTTKSHAKHEGNPFGGFSHEYYKLGMAYANALEAGDDAAILAARNALKALSQKIEDSSIPVLGASTGAGQAVSTNDRTTRIGVSSLDVPSRDDNSTAAGNLPGRQSEESWIDPESVNHLLEIALKLDIKRDLGNTRTFASTTAALGIDPADVGGPMTANEYRYLLRSLGSYAVKYPGKGKMRSALKIPRDGKGWWKPGEDPEIEQAPNGQNWESAWVRNGNQYMGGTEIVYEMTEEVREFEQLGIPTARKIQHKAGGKVEVVSKVAVGNTIKSGLNKIKIIAAINKGYMGMDEEIQNDTKGNVFFEGIDAIDRKLIADAADFIIRRTQRLLVLESA